ncbi:hypothetical protein LN042_22010 [Kitasatospora sp. RB6PN24]|uniref:hypothetical protein n=1 Tax=Kitasatospora humi TaxID=2893891 RepID=UPI001E31E54B|nr:hypothetical protein [Kitasatospora humi]MCC9309717.1 hypothetical protein [Kitasatospora humi]
MPEDSRYCGPRGTDDPLRALDLARHSPAAGQGEDRGDGPADGRGDDRGDGPRAACALCGEPTEYPADVVGSPLCPRCAWQQAQRAACSG